MVGGEHLLSVARTIAVLLSTLLLRWEQQLARTLRRSFCPLLSGFSVHTMLAEAAAAISEEQHCGANYTASQGGVRPIS